MEYTIEDWLNAHFLVAALSIIISRGLAYWSFTRFLSTKVAGYSRPLRNTLVG